MHLFLFKYFLDSILLSILEQSSLKTVENAQFDPSSVASQSKFSELTMKCIWKMTKVVPQLIEGNSLDVSDLILSVDKFLANTPPIEWKKRAADKIIPQADMPLRTVKTILNEMVNVLGESIFEYVHNISDIEKSHALLYLRQMVEQEKRKTGGSEDNSGSESSSRASSTTNVHREPEKSSSNPSTPPSVRRPLSVQLPQRNLAGLVGANSRSFSQGRPLSLGSMSKAEADARLTIIFGRIAQKDETKQGISDLHEFKKQFPQFEDLVETHLGRTGNYFQGYIKRGLNSLLSEEITVQSANDKAAYGIFESENFFYLIINIFRIQKFNCRPGSRYNNIFFPRMSEYKI